MTTSMVVGALQSLAHATSVAEEYAVTLDFERFATPGEFAAIFPHIENRGGPFAERTRAMHDVTFLECDAPARYVRERTGNVCLFRADGARRLAIGFCGRDYNLSMATATQLQYFGPHANLLMVQDPTRRGFLFGDGRNAGGFEELVRVLSRTYRFDTYQDIVTFGASSGGCPALAAGAMIGASSAVAFAGRPDLVGGDGDAKARTREMHAILKPARTASRAFAVYAAENDQDAANARRLGRLAPLELIAVDRTDDHNVVIDLHYSFRLRALYERTGLVAPRTAASPGNAGAQGT